MYSSIRKIAYKWRLFVPLVFGGAVIGVTIWWFHRRSLDKGSRSLLLNDEPAIQPMDNPMQSHHRLVSYRSTTSIASHASTLSYRRSLRDPAYRQLSASHNFIDSDPEDGSSVCLDQRRLGLSALAGVVEHLESLMSKVRMCEEKGAVAPCHDTEQLIDDLRILLEHAYKLREQYKLNLLIHDDDYRDDDQGLDIGSEDETCSYFSASEELDLSELEIVMSQNVQNAIYYKALKLLDGGEILYRSLRTEFVGCKLDIEYIGKVHCIRQAFDYIFARPEPTAWLATIGKLNVFRFLHCLGYSITDFSEAYERLIEFVSSQRNKPNSMMIEELYAKGVKVINFFDVVFDLMLLEAFELLANPPGAVLSVTRHRWLSDNFKRCALDSTVWTILMAKRKLLKFPDGFYAHYYSMIGTLLPALAWGFLGPDPNGNRISYRFREIVVQFVRESFVCHDSRQTDHSHSESSTLIPDLSASGLMDDVATRVVQNSPKHSMDRLGIDSPNHLPGKNDRNDKINNQNKQHNDNNENCDDDDDDDNSLTPVNSINDVNAFPILLDNQRQIGLRYTTLAELGHDLYNLIDLYSNLLKDMFVEESKALENPLPAELCDNPIQPPLRYPIP